MFLGPGYFCSNDGEDWSSLRHFLEVNLHIYIYIYIYIYITSQCLQFQCLRVIGRDSGLSTLCHSCELACQ